MLGLAVYLGSSPGASRSAGPALLASSGPGVRVRLHPAAAFDGGTVPAYFVVVNGRSAEVLASANGSILATIRTPTASAGYFQSVSGASDDRTFVLAAVRHLRTELYLLRLNPQAGVAELSPLPVTLATPVALQFAGLALSPDGTRLAVAVNDWASASARTTRPRTARGCDCGPRVWVYDLATGARREWVWPGAAYVTSAVDKGEASLSWTANDKSLAFDISGFSGASTTVRLLDTTAPGMDLSKSRVVSSVDQQIESPLITADGAAIAFSKNEAAIGKRGLAHETLSISKFSVRPGRPVMVVYQRHYVVPPSEGGNLGLPPSVLWANPAGTVLIISTGAELAAQSGAVGVLNHGTFTLLPSQGSNPARTIAQGYISAETAAW